MILQATSGTASVTPTCLDKNYVLRFMPGRNASRTALSAYRRWRFRGGAGEGRRFQGIDLWLCFTLKMYFLLKKHVFFFRKNRGWSLEGTAKFYPFNHLKLGDCFKLQLPMTGMQWRECFCRKLLLGVKFTCRYELFSNFQVFSKNYVFGTTFFFENWTLENLMETQRTVS